jgi:PAS domain S-box-containing protein
MESPDSKSHSYPLGRRVTPFLALAAGLLFTFIVSYRLEKVGEAQDRARFQGLVQEVHAGIESRLEAYTSLLRAGTGLFVGSENVSGAEFKKFVETLNLADHYPGVQGMGFSLRLTPEERVALISNQRQQGHADFHLWPESQEANKAEYHAVLYLEPEDERNRAAIGFDMSTVPTRLAAMNQARDTGAPAATGPVTLFQFTSPQLSQPGFVIYAPVYKKGSQPADANSRREALVGFVFSPFRTEDFFRGIIMSSATNNVAFQVYDDAESTPPGLVYSSPESAISPAYEPRFIATTTLTVGGRPWSIKFASRPGFDVALMKSWVPYTFAAGIFISLLFFGITWSQTRAREEAERSEADVRKSESLVRKTLEDRERAEAAVKESEERYRELVENANDIVFSLDLDGNLISVNKAVESITGFKQSDLVGMNMSEFLTPISDQSARQMTQRKLAGEERTNYEVEVQTKTGSLVTLEISSRLAFSDGKPVGIQGVARDISTRRQAEEALRQADQRALSEYERLLEKVTGLAQTLGTARDLRAIFRGLRDFTLLSVPCDGLFVSLYDPIRDVRTACYGWGDLEEIDTSQLPPMPVNNIGPNSRAIRTNKVIITDDYMNTTRGHPAVIVGPDNGARPQSSLCAPMAVMGRIIGTIEVQSYERFAYREEHITAMRLAANLTAVAVENVGLLERESTARAAAEESNRLKDEFLATVSHELRTPLTAILGWSRMLESASLDAEIAKRAIDTIKRNAKVQAQIVDDILDVSRIITGNLYLELQPIELAPVLESAINVVRPTADAKGIQIEVDFSNEPTAVPGDADRLQQVFWNLLSNAVKFTPSGGKVRVQLRKVDSKVEVEVADTGKGITAEFLPFVFDRFRQADSTSTRQHGGLGLGLAIARHLIEIHGGSIQALSEGDGAGARFIVSLPIVGAAEVVPDVDADRETEQQILKSRDVLADLDVLIVDDDEDTLELLSAALSNRSANVTAVSSAAEAIAAIKNARPDVLISDIAMPGEDGYDLIRKVIRLNVVPRIPAIAITAYAKEEDKDRALSAGYQRYLSKPVELGEFISLVAATAKFEFPKEEKQFT